MGRPKKLVRSKENVTAYIPCPLALKVREYAYVNDMSQSEAVSKIIQQFFEDMPVLLLEHQAQLYEKAQVQKKHTLGAHTSAELIEAAKKFGFIPE